MTGYKQCYRNMPSRGALLRNITNINMADSHPYLRYVGQDICVFSKESSPALGPTQSLNEWAQILVSENKAVGA